jgi:hypothetical protein
MINQTLGRLTRVNLRQIWGNEASDFTPWLALEENLSTPKLLRTICKQAGTQEYFVSCLWKRGFDLFTVLFDDRPGGGLHLLKWSERENFTGVGADCDLSDLTERAESWVGEQNRRLPDKAVLIELGPSRAKAIRQMIIQETANRRHHFDLCVCQI